MEVSQEAAVVDLLITNRLVRKRIAIGSFMSMVMFSQSAHTGHKMFPCLAFPPSIRMSGGVYLKFKRKI